MQIAGGWGGVLLGPVSTGCELLVVPGAPNTAPAPASEKEVLEVWQSAVFVGQTRSGAVL